MTDKQRIFCDEYLIDLNATRAYMAAYPNVKSERTAAAAAARLLRNVNIQEYIQKRLKEKEDALIAKQDEVLKYLTATMRREKKESVVVTLKKKKTWTDEHGRKQSGEIDESEIVEIPAKISDANKAAEMLGKYYTLFTDKTQLDGSALVTIVDDIE